MTLKRMSLEAYTNTTLHYSHQMLIDHCMRRGISHEGYVFLHDHNGLGGIQLLTAEEYSIVKLERLIEG
jgi:hypothetical protein